MKKNKSTDQPLRSDLEWEEDDEETDKEFQKFLDENRDLIRAITPVNPVITKDDPWYYEDCWDEDYKQYCLAKEKSAGRSR